MLFDDYGDLLNLIDVSEILDISTTTVAQLCRTGKIKAFKAGREWRIAKLALETYVFEESNYTL